MVLSNSTPGELAYIWKGNWIGIIATTTEKNANLRRFCRRRCPQILRSHRSETQLTEGKLNDAVTPVQAFFFLVFTVCSHVNLSYDMIPIRSGEISRPRDLIEARFASFSLLKLTQEIKRDRLVASLSGEFLDDLG